MFPRFGARFAIGVFLAGLLVSPCLGQSQSATFLFDPASFWTAASANEPEPLPGSVTGTVVDQTGALVAGAQVKLIERPQSPDQLTLTDSNGQFAFARVDPGTFQLVITNSGFEPHTVSGEVHSGESATLPLIVLGVASARVEVQVGLTRPEVAEDQIHMEEKQRILGVIPNFYVSYVPNAVALTSRQKFKLAARSVVDPFTFLVVGGTAGLQQAQNHFVEYGQGMQGYSKRFAANYADTVSSTFIGGAILPSLLKQDPRYFYKGTGSFGSRFLYAISMALVCKGDNGRWQPNYSGILGSLAAGGISNLYYPSADRNSAALTFDNTAIGIASNAATNILQEFVIPRFSTKAPHHRSDQP